MILIVLLAWLLCCSVEARADTLYVRASGPLHSIQTAVGRARAGDTIKVYPGVYVGNIVLGKPLVMEGVGNPVIRGEGRGSVITVTGAGCTIRGFIIEHSGGMLVEEDSAILLRSDGNRIQSNTLRDTLFGIYFYRSNGNVVSGNSIDGRSWLESGERGSGIHIWDSERNSIIGNTISMTRDGMYLQNANKSYVAGNRVHDLRYGLHYMFSNDNRFEGNDFYNNVAGAAIMYSHNIQFRRNAFVQNRGFSSYGILFQDSHNCVAEENTISDNAIGIFMEALTDTVFRRNTIAANDIAIQAFSSAAGDVFTANNFIANLSPFQLVGKTADLRWSHGQTGNYWSEYDGYDLDHDGIGDVPFRIQNVFEHLEGNYPRLRLYLLSPASTALAASERFLPVFETPKAIDALPLMRPVSLSVREPQRNKSNSGRMVSLAMCLCILSAAAGILAIGTGRWSKSAS